MLGSLQGFQLFNGFWQTGLLADEEAAGEEEHSLLGVVEDSIELEEDSSALLDDTAGPAVQWSLASKAKREVPRAPLSRAPRGARVVAAKAPAALAQPAEQAAARLLRVVRPTRKEEFPDVTDLLEPETVLLTIDDGIEVLGFESDQMPVAQAVTQKGPQTLSRPESIVRTVAHSVMKAAAVITVGAVGMALTAGEAAAKLIQKNPYVIKAEDVTPVIEKVSFWESLGTGGQIGVGVGLTVVVSALGVVIYVKAIKPWRAKKKAEAQEAQQEPVLSKAKPTEGLVIGFSKLVRRLGLFGLGPETEGGLVTWEQRVQAADVADLPEFIAEAFSAEALGLKETSHHNYPLRKALTTVAKHAILFADPNQIAELEERRKALDETREAINTLQTIRSDMNSDGEGGGEHPVFQAVEEYLATVGALLEISEERLAHVEKVNQAIAVMEVLKLEIEALELARNSLVQKGELLALQKRILEVLERYHDDAGEEERVKSLIAILHDVLCFTESSNSSLSIPGETTKPIRDRLSALCDGLFLEVGTATDNSVILDIVGGFADDMRELLENPIFQTPYFQEEHREREELAGFTKGVEQTLLRLDVMFKSDASLRFGNTVFHDVFWSLHHLEDRLHHLRAIVVEGLGLIEGEATISPVVARIDVFVERVQILRAAVLTMEFQKVNSTSFHADRFQIPAPTNLHEPRLVPSQEELQAMSASELFDRSLAHLTRSLLTREGGNPVKKEMVRFFAKTIYLNFRQMLASPSSIEWFNAGLLYFTMQKGDLDFARDNYIDGFLGASGPQNDDVFLQEVGNRVLAFEDFKRKQDRIAHVRTLFDVIEPQVAAALVEPAASVVKEKLQRVQEAVDRVMQSTVLDYQDLSLIKGLLEEVVQALIAYETHFYHGEEARQTGEEARQTNNIRRALQEVLESLTRVP